MSINEWDAWPPNRFEELKQKWGLSTLKCHRTLNGKSGASIFLVESNGAHDGYAILKLSGSQQSSEIANHKAAISTGGDFATRRFPKIAFDYKADTWSATLMAVAGDGLKYVDALTDVAEVERIKALGPIVDGLLSEWNAAAEADREGCSAHDLLHNWLGTKLEFGGRIEKVCEAITGLPTDTAGFQIDGHEFPSPLAACLDSASPLRDIRLSPIVGYQHGDFHGRNILVHAPRGESAVDFFIIDFEQYRSSCPILFDLAYLELSQLLAMRQMASQSRWLELVDVTARLLTRFKAIEAATHADDVGMIRFSGQLRDLMFGWQAKRFAQRREDIERQCRLACVAAGLDFASKRNLSDNESISTKLKEFAYLYAATHLRELYEFERITLPATTPVRARTSTRRSSNNAWRQVWQAADSFNQSRNAFVLIAGPALRDLDTVAKEALVRLPWALAIDFDTVGDEDSLFQAAKRQTARLRGFHHLVLGQRDVDVNFNAGMVWLMADGWSVLPESIPKSIAEWRKCGSEYIRNLGSRLHSQSAPRPVTVIALVDGIEPPKLRGAYSAVTEHIENARLIIVQNAAADLSINTLKEEAVHVQIVECKFRDLAIGIANMIGDAPIASTVRLPARVDDDKFTTIDIPPVQALLFAENLELVHDGLAQADPGGIPSGPSFSEGAVVSWHDLNRNLDVARNLTNEMHGPITEHLKDARIIAVTLKHKPGAGGTTIVRRLAWEFRNLYPTVLVKLYNKSVAGHIETIYQLTGLPILIIAERANLLSADRERLFNDIRSRHVRFVFVDVIRSINLTSENLTFPLDDQMIQSEAQRFFELYSRWCSQDRRSRIRRLTTDEILRDFRSPFFYSLYAFENEFNNVQDYISSYLNELTDEQKELIAFLGLIGSYSQHWLPFASLKLISKQVFADEPRLSDILGEGARKFILYDGANVKVVHPILAKEILRQHLRPTASIGRDDWKFGLTDFSVAFIERVSDKKHRGSEAIEDILTDLFVSRTDGVGQTERAEFSELILALPTPQSRKRALEKLCEKFANPHYWNHLGRLLNFEKLETFEVAAQCYKKAISLAEDDGAHYHGLGMVYRNEMRDRLWPFLQPNESLSDRLGTIESIYRLAEEAFERARDLNTADEYPRISHIQMITRAIEQILKISNSTTYPELLNRADSVGDWCRSQLMIAQRLMDEVYHINAERELNRVAIEASGHIDEVFGNFETMVRGLTELLGRDGVPKAEVRRSLARCYLRQVGGNLTGLKPQNARRIAQLARENVNENPRNGIDLRMWFQAYRLLPEFTIDEAIERLN
jgi:tetratricopeptide (TPR) repeat protein